MSELRILDIPPNRTGLTEGCWLRWAELRLFLLEQNKPEVADAIEQQISNGETLSARKVEVRR